MQIWGSDSAADEAVQALKGLVADLRADSASKPHSWAKTNNLSAYQQRKLEKKLRDEELLQSFRQLSPPGNESYYSFRQEINWPDIDTAPQKVLGSNLEALDKIRLDCRCYIFPVRERASHRVAVWGNSGDSFADAVSRVDQVFTQIVARNFVPPDYFLIKPSRKDAARQNVQLVPYFGPRFLDSKGHSRQPDGCVVVFARPPSSNGQGLRESTKGNNSGDTFETQEIFREGQNLLILEAITIATLKRLVFYAGSVRMRARLSSFVVTRYKNTPNGQYSFKEFEDMLDGYNKEEEQILPILTTE